MSNFAYVDPSEFGAFSDPGFGYSGFNGQPVSTEFSAEGVLGSLTDIFEPVLGLYALNMQHDLQRDFLAAGNQQSQALKQVPLQNVGAVPRDPISAARAVQVSATSGGGGGFNQQQLLIGGLVIAAAFFLLK